MKLRSLLLVPLAIDALGVCAVLPLVLGLLAAIDGVLALKTAYALVLAGPVTFSAAYLSRHAARAPLDVLRGVYAASWASTRK